MINKDNITTLIEKYQKDLEEYEKEYKYESSTEHIEYWEGTIHKTEQIIKDLERLLK